MQRLLGLCSEGASDIRYPSGSQPLIPIPVLGRFLLPAPIAPCTRAGFCAQDLSLTVLWQVVSGKTLPEEGPKESRGPLGRADTIGPALLSWDVVVQEPSLSVSQLH